MSEVPLYPTKHQPQAGEGAQGDGASAGTEGRAWASIDLSVYLKWRVGLEWRDSHVTHQVGGPSDVSTAAALYLGSSLKAMRLHGYLTYKKMQPPRTLP